MTEFPTTRRFPRTIADNNLDMKRKQRHAFGVRNAQAKLNERTVRLIRSDTRSERLAGKAFGVSPALIGLIRRRVIWRHIP